MKDLHVENSLQQSLQRLSGKELSLLDFMPDGNLAEKVIDLALNGPPPCSSSRISSRFKEIAELLARIETDCEKVVIFGGGSGLSNILGGDSRRKEWGDKPFTGLKEFFSHISSIVCITDDGGSTGELLKDLPLVALGDIRHVLLSSIRKKSLQKKYGLDAQEALSVARQLHLIFNHRFSHRPASPEILTDATLADFQSLPGELRTVLQRLIGKLFSDPRLSKTLERPQCLGNLLLVASVFIRLTTLDTADSMISRYDEVRKAILRGLSSLAEVLGGHPQGVLPCVTSIAQLQILYENGVLVTSESKSSLAKRSYPVDRVFVEFFQDGQVPGEIVEKVEQADLLIFAPGSLYTSIIPILQAPGLAEVVKNNGKALKLLVANIWAQKGETDVARDAPDRKFHVSDLIRAYNRNIPGGVQDLFSTIIALKLGEIPGSVLQSYALEEKEPIYVDRDRIRSMGFDLIEASIFSRQMLEQRGVIQHDPQALAVAVKTLVGLKKNKVYQTAPRVISGLPQVRRLVVSPREGMIPCMRYATIASLLSRIVTEISCPDPGNVRPMDDAERNAMLGMVHEIIWRHPDILIDHLRFILGITLIDPSDWSRCQEWDNVFSFYDPNDRHVKIRSDQFQNPLRFEVAFLVALGQSLLGNYALEKQMDDLAENGFKVGRIYRVVLRDIEECHSFFTREELEMYLRLARMGRQDSSDDVYVRLVNGTEGFTPPGLLFGLFYAWYLDNRFSTHIEYKMAIMKHEVSNLIPEQVKTVSRREGMIQFFRERVFRHRIRLS